MLTIKYPEEIFHRLKYEKEMNESRRVRQRCSLVVHEDVRYLKLHGYKYRKMGQVPGKADPELQKEWLDKLLKKSIKDVVR